MAEAAPPFSSQQGASGLGDVVTQLQGIIRQITNSNANVTAQVAALVAQLAADNAALVAQLLADTTSLNAQLVTNNTALIAQLASDNSALVAQIAASFALQTGSFTLSGATATTVVSDARVGANSTILWSPTNASAGTLIGSVKSLFVVSISAGVSFSVKTANATLAAGTETFNYIIWG